MNEKTTPAQGDFVIKAKTIKGSSIQIDLAAEYIIMPNGDYLPYFKSCITPESQTELHFDFNGKVSRTILDNESSKAFWAAHNDYQDSLKSITLNLGTRVDGGGALIWKGSVKLGAGEILNQCYSLLHKHPVQENVKERQILNVITQMKNTWRIFNESPEQRLKQAQTVIDNTHIDVVNLYNELGGDLDLLEFGKEHDFWAALCAYREAIETISELKG